MLVSVSKYILDVPALLSHQRYFSWILGRSPYHFSLPSVQQLQNGVLAICDLGPIGGRDRNARGRRPFLMMVSCCMDGIPHAMKKTTREFHCVIAKSCISEYEP